MAADDSTKVADDPERFLWADGDIVITKPKGKAQAEDKAAEAEGGR